MAEDQLYDLCIIGAGPGGYHSAIRAAQLGAKVVLIEKDKLGGTCSNWGCIPTKALFASAKLVSDIREKAESFGIITGPVTTDFAKAVDRKNEVVTSLVDGIAGLLKAQKVKVLFGTGKVEGGNVENGFTVSSTDKEGQVETLVAKRLLIATGSTPAMIPAFNIDHQKIITSDDILAPEFKSLPEKMLIIGAGVIGCEFANIFAAFGVKIIMLEFLDTMLATEEPSVVKELKKKFDALGIEVNTSQNVLSVVATDSGVTATTVPASVPKEEIENAEKSVFDADLCLVSIGRAKISADLGLEDLGVVIERGQIKIDKATCETDAKGVYAIGDVTGVMMLAHVASHQGDVAVANALHDLGFDVEPRTANYDFIPYTIFTNPNIGSVGLREKVAKEKLGKVNTGRFFYGSLGKARCMDETDGFMMIVADEASDNLVGATCIGAEAPELISEITVAMQTGITAQQLGEIVHSHPTISEMVIEAVEDVHGMAIHKAGRRK
jgi:dihydrolipoamide dehydrogenase